MVALQYLILNESCTSCGHNYRHNVVIGFKIIHVATKIVVVDHTLELS